jgi:hypothetical protein
MYDQAPFRSRIEGKELSVKKLGTLSLSALPLQEVLRGTTAPSGPGWKVAASEDNFILFTQLVSSSGAMRDDYYEYLLAIGRKLVIISFSEGEARIVQVGAWNEFPRDLIISIANRAAELVTVERKPFVWAKS